MGLIKEEESSIKKIFGKVLRRDFSGNTGLAIKNSAYQFSSNIVQKLGSLVFVIILARIILPETFGLYNLVFSTIMFFYVFSDAGIYGTLVYFTSKSLNRNKGKVKAYIDYLFKIKFFVVLMSAFALIILAKFIADSYYRQPIFLALIAGSLYIIFMGLQNFYLAISQANNNFKNPFFKEIFFQISRMIVIPAAILYIRKFNLPNQTIVLTIFIILAIIAGLSMSLMHFLSIKDLNLQKIKKANLSKAEKAKIRKFMINLVLITSSILILGNIDKIIIGPFVPPEFVGYYSAAFSLVNASAFLLVFSDVFFPIFLRIKGKRLEQTFKKVALATFFMSFFLFSFLLIFATPLVNIIFGVNYIQSINMLRMLAFLALFFPLIELYTSYIISKGNLDKIKKVVFFILIISIVLPLILVKTLSVYGNSMAVFGLIMGVLISKAAHLGSLMWISKRI